MRAVADSATSDGRERARGSFNAGDERFNAGDERFNAGDEAPCVREVVHVSSPLRGESRTSFS
jgi:hypothetical protein